jgi:pimeloyl-ACP methyl ester carboxylesterase
VAPPAIGTRVFPEVARFTRVVSYDRAGYGKSEPGPAPRSQERLAKELHTLLHNAGIMPPYVLVGHSLGGANIRAFAISLKTRWPAWCSSIHSRNASSPLKQKQN